MPAETADTAALLHRIRELAKGARDGTPEAMRSALDAIADSASGHLGDTLEPSDMPQTENQTL